MTLEEEFKKCNLNSLIDRMTLYVCVRLKSYNLKNLEGKEPVDFVMEVLTKVADGSRDWYKAKCSFDLFLFGCLKSDLNGFFKKSGMQYVPELEDIVDSDDSTDITEKKAEIIQIMIQEGADDCQIKVFECWMDGMLKPQEVAKYLEIEVTKVNNATKRISKLLPKIHSLIQA